ncbi:17beta-estradiol 17-dehydrogenase / very-long-chain 3-oxoacyl-CoA reductase [Nematocida sp. AWRm77]|nr:17beta-estradiol 17-dehydrogenase / very-long-chain 3-oxoacyl-CoA reductase [Nematocida sp. AWRm77]
MEGSGRVGLWIMERCIGGCVFILGIRVMMFLAGSFVQHAVRYLNNRKILKEAQGKWGIVTGATDGIGLAIAKELAKNQINLILISRSEEKLKAVKKEIGNTVKIDVIAADFTQEIDFHKILSKKKAGKDVFLLVNNVGINGKGPTLYTEHAVQFEDDIIKVNIQNTLRITREFLSWDASPKSKKYVLSVGSMLGLFPSPYQQIYSGTKAFLQLWSESISAEISTNYHFEVLMTGLVCTKLSGTKRATFFTPSSQHYGTSCVHAFGSTSVTYPYFPHELLSFLSSLVPRQLLAQAFKLISLAIRKRIAAKQKKTDKIL